MRRHSANVVLMTALMALMADASAAIDPARLEAARRLYGERQNEQARVAYETMRVEDGTAPEPWFYLGLLAMRRDDAEQAAALLAKAVELKPNDAEFFRRLGDACGRAAQKAGLLAKLGWAGKSRAAYERAVQIAPDSIDARISAMNFYAEAPAIVGGGFDKAHAQADAIIALDANQGRVAKAKLFRRENKPLEAIAIFEEALAQNPGDYFALHEIGRLAHETGVQLDRGLEALSQCLDRPVPEGSPGHDVIHWRIGAIQALKGDAQAARESLEKSLAIDPSFGPAKDALKKLP